MSIVISNQLRLYLAIIFVARDRKIKIDTLFMEVFTKNDPELKELIQNSGAHKKQDYHFSLMDIEKYYALPTEELIERLKGFKYEKKRKAPLVKIDKSIDDIIADIF